MRTTCTTGITMDVLPCPAEGPALCRYSGRVLERRSNPSIFLACSPLASKLLRLMRGSSFQQEDTMALSNFLIRPPSDAQPARHDATRHAAAPQAANASAFADIMNGQSANAGTSGTEKLPTGMPTVQGMGQSGLVLAGRTPNDMVRARIFTKAEADMRQTKAIEGLMQSTGSGGSTLDLARSMGTARHLRAITGSMDNQLKGAGLGDFVHTRGHAGARPAKTPRMPENSELGQLSARFESGADGVAAVGYDRNGGTSYGKYQVSSRAGSLGEFLRFLDTEAPDLARRLRSSGPGNTGSTRGAMPTAWRAIAAEQPDRFEALQESFVLKSHYRPAVESIAQRTGLSSDTMSTALREVIWSTAVQHGPNGAARIFERANSMSGKPSDPAYEQNLINNVYKIRSRQFGASDSNIQAAVVNRFKQERLLALNMLNGGKNSALA